MAAIHEMASELHEIARLCCEATGEERGLRSALECVRAALEELRRYDVRELLRCPECGDPLSCVRLGHEDETSWWWECWHGHHHGPTRDTQLAALLAWHGREER